MGNVVDLRPRGSAAKPEEITCELDQIRELLAGAMQNLREAEGKTWPCHLALVSGIEARMAQAAKMEYETNPRPRHELLSALSLIEVARLTLETGGKSFKGCGLLSYGLAIADALEAALNLLDASITGPPTDEYPA